MFKTAALVLSTLVLSSLAFGLGLQILGQQAGFQEARQKSSEVRLSEQAFALQFEQKSLLGNTFFPAEETAGISSSPAPAKKAEQRKKEEKDSSPKVNGVSAQASPPPSTTPTPEYRIQPFPTADPSACPKITQACVPCIAGESYCRYEQGASEGYLGWACQNNNPGNIRYSQSRIDIMTAYGGYAPCGSRGPHPGSQYMAFNTYTEGKESLKAYLKGIRYGAHSAYLPQCNNGDCSLKFFFSKYAPAGDQNDPNSYSNFVANYIGVDVDNTPLRWIINNKLSAFADAIQVHEGWFVE